MSHMPENKLSEAYLMYLEIKTNFNAEPFISYVMERRLVGSRKEAYDTFDAVLQWLTCQVHATEQDKKFVMMSGEVNDVYNALREFDSARCIYDLGISKEHQAVFFSHTPLTGTKSDWVLYEENLQYTILQLDQAFGNDLVRPLASWIGSLGKKLLYPCALSCVHVERRTQLKRHYG